ncbi:MAG: alpha/beta fold hydrolase [Corynebacterium sp.]|nr:alpha/beta fold hydrolase [Corynebacterium sp.]
MSKALGIHEFVTRNIISEILATESRNYCIGAETRLGELGDPECFGPRVNLGIARRCALGLPDGALGVDVTVAQLAACFDAERRRLFRSRRRGPVARGLPFPASGAGFRKQPLHYVVGAGAGAEGYRPLWEPLGRRRPVFLYVQRGLEVRGAADRTVDGNARRHVAELTERCPDGPYDLIGHSFGALVALEMAVLLRRQSRSVRTLILMDPVLRSMSGGSVAEFDVEPTTAGAARPSVTARLLTHLRIALAGALQFDADTHQSVLWEVGIRAQNRYWPTEIPPGTFLLMTRQNRRFIPAWRSIEPSWDRLKILEVPGDHVGMLAESEVLRTVERILGEPMKVDDDS